MRISWSHTRRTKTNSSLGVRSKIGGSRSDGACSRFCAAYLLRDSDGRERGRSCSFRDLAQWVGAYLSRRLSSGGVTGRPYITRIMHEYTRSGGSPTDARRASTPAGSSIGE